MRKRRLPAVPAKLRAGMTLSELAMLLWSQACDVASIAALLLCGVALWLLSSPTKFTSRASLYFGEVEASSGTQSVRTSTAQGDRWDLESELEILASMSAVRRAVSASGLNVVVSRPGSATDRNYEFLLSGRKSPSGEIVGGLRAAYAAGGSGRYRVEFVSPTQYELRNPTGVVEGSGTLGVVSSFGQLRLSLFAGPAEVPRAGDRFDVLVLPLEDVVAEAHEELSVWAPKSEAGSPTKVVTLSFSARSHAAASLFLAELMKDYLDGREKWRVEDASALDEFLGEQLEAVRLGRDGNQVRIARQRSMHPRALAAGAAQGVVARNRLVEQELVAAKLELDALLSLQRSLAGQNLETEAFMVGEAVDPFLSKLGRDLAQATSKLQDLRSRFAATSPDVMRARSQVEAQLEAIKNYLSSRIRRAGNQVASLAAANQQYEAELGSVPTAQMGLTRLMVEAEVLDATYSSLLERKLETAMDRGARTNKNRVLDPPELAVTRISPSLWTLWASIPLAVLFGALAVSSRALFSSRVQTERQATMAAGGLPIFAKVPHRGGRGSWLKGAQLGDGSDLETFRQLRSTLYNAGLTAEGRVLAVTSAARGDGKTTCCRSLACALAADHKSVLIVDTEFARGSSAQNDRSISRHNENSARSPLPGLAASAGTVTHVSLGEVLPIEGLSSDGVNEFLIKARREYNFVLLDCANAITTTGAHMLVGVADCVLAIVRLRHTRQDLAEQHCRWAKQHSHHGGVLLNDVSWEPAAFGAG